MTQGSQPRAAIRIGMPGYSLQDWDSCGKVTLETAAGDSKTQLFGPPGLAVLDYREEQAPAFERDDV